MNDILRKPLADSNVLVLGTLRDVGVLGLKTIKVLSRAFRTARSLSFLLVESDSQDDSCGLIANYIKANAMGELYRLGDIRDSIPKRTERIAHCRNYYLDLIRQPKYSEIDYFCIADLDGVNKHLQPNSIESCWSMSVDWDVVTANQLGRYYDIWALRSPSWCEGDCWVAYKEMLSYTSPMQAFASAVKSKYIVIKEDAGPILTSSSFGGLAIYNSCLRDGDFLYSGVSENGDEVCEHVSLNNAISSLGGKIYINPRLINRIRGSGLRAMPWHLPTWIKSAFR